MADGIAVIQHAQACELVSPSAAALARVPDGADVVGAGIAVLAAAGVAALKGLDCSFVRAEPKTYGTRRQRDGCWDSGRPTVALYATAADRRALEQCVPAVCDWIHVQRL